MPGTLFSSGGAVFWGAFAAHFLFELNAAALEPAFIVRPDCRLLAWRVRSRALVPQGHEPPPPSSSCSTDGEVLFYHA